MADQEDTASTCTSPTEENETWVNVEEERASSGFASSQAEGLYSDISDGSGMEDMIAEALRDSDVATEEREADRHSEAVSPHCARRTEVIPEELYLPDSVTAAGYRCRSSTSYSALHQLPTAGKEPISVSASRQLPNSGPAGESEGDVSHWYRLFSGRLSRLLELVSSHPNLVIAATVVSISVCIWKTRRTVLL